MALTLHLEENSQLVINREYSQPQLVQADKEEDAFIINSEALSQDQHNCCTNDANAWNYRVKDLVKDFESFSSFSDSSDHGNIFNSTTNSEGNDSSNGGKRVRRRWVFPTSSLRLLSAQHQYSGCEGTEAPKNGVWKLNYAEREGKNDKKVVKITSVQPFDLKTERRGQLKEQEFMKKLHEMLAQEEKRRIPIAKRLPLTTDEPQIFPKPPVRGQTKPLDVKLHSHTRAIERAEFNHLIAEKIYFLEQRRLEEERIQKLIEMDEVKKMRQTMIPRAQMMPFFDRPFIPQRSARPLTVPKEPIFHIPRRKRANWGLCM